MVQALNYCWTVKCDVSVIFIRTKVEILKQKTMGYIICTNCVFIQLFYFLIVIDQNINFSKMRVTTYNTIDILRVRKVSLIMYI